MKCRAVYNLATGSAWRAYGDSVWMRSRDGTRYEGRTDREGFLKTGPDKDYIKGDMSIEHQLVPLIALRLAKDADAIRGVEARPDGSLVCFMAYSVMEQRPVAYSTFDKTYHNGPVRLLGYVFDKDQRLVERSTASDPTARVDRFSYEFGPRHGLGASVPIADVAHGWMLTRYLLRDATPADETPAEVWRAAVLSRTAPPPRRVDLRTRPDADAGTSDGRSKSVGRTLSRAGDNPDVNESTTPAHDDLSVTSAPPGRDRLRVPLVATGAALIILASIAWWRRR